MTTKEMASGLADEIRYIRRAIDEEVSELVVMRYGRLTELDVRGVESAVANAIQDLEKALERLEDAEDVLCLHGGEPRD